MICIQCRRTKPLEAFTIHPDGRPSAVCLACEGNGTRKVANNRPRTDTPRFWAWSSYRKEGWALPDGRRLYVGRFRAEVSLDTHVLIVAQFWARRPLVSLRRACSVPRTEAGLLAFLENEAV